MKLSKTFIFAFLSLAGFALMLWSVQEWFQLMLGEKAGASFCSIDYYWDCDRVSLTSLGAPFGIPIGIFGALWFVVGSFLAYSQKVSQTIFRLHLALGLLVVIVLSSQLLFVYEAGCIVCYISYLIILALAFVGFRLKEEGPQLSLGISAAVSGAFLFILSIVVMDGATELDKRTASESEFTSWVASMPLLTTPLESPFKKGHPQAKIKVVEFAAFTCGHCQRAAVNYRPYLANQEDFVEFHFIPFPFDSDCNPSIKNGHSKTCEVAKTGFCALEQNKFWQFHDYVFERAAQGNIPKLPSIAKGIGADLVQLRECLAKPETENNFQKLMMLAKEADVQATPTFFINGRRVEGYVPLKRFKRLIDYFSKNAP